MSVPMVPLAAFSVLPYTDVLAWIVVGIFAAGALADWWGSEAPARYLLVAAWGLFGVFWLLLIHYFALVHRSIVQTALLVIAVPSCFYVGYRLLAGEEIIFVLSRAIAVMGVLYLPFQMLPAAQGFLIEVVAQQSHAVMNVLGFGAIALVESESKTGAVLTNTFANDVAGVRNTHVVLACTGIESMAMFGGLIAAVRAPLRRKVAGFAVAIASIWLLNIARNVFIALANAYQWFAIAWLEGPVMAAFGLSDPTRVSFFVADRVISQGLAVFALIGVAWLVARWVPELLDLLEELLSLLVGADVQLRAPEAATDGGNPGE